MGGVGGFGLGGHGVAANNALSSLLGDLAFLGGTAEGVVPGGPGASRTVMLPGGGVAGAGGANGARQVDIHIAFMPQTAQPVAAPRYVKKSFNISPTECTLSSNLIIFAVFAERPLRRRRTAQPGMRSRAQSCRPRWRRTWPRARSC